MEVEPFSWTAFLQPARDFKTWAFAILFLAITAVAYSMAFFLPIILKNGLGFSVSAALCLTAAPYAFAAIVMFIGAWAGDRFRVRSPIIATNAILAIIGLSLMGHGPSPPVQYLGAFFVAAGANAGVLAIMAYQANNIRGQWHRAFASATLIGIGGVGGIIGAVIFPPEDAPQYLTGIWTCIALMLLILVIIATLSVYSRRQNRKADRDGVRLESHGGFRYTI